MSPSARLLAAALLAAGLTIACDQPGSPGDGGDLPDADADASSDADAGPACGACHGPDETGAPPPDLSGSTDRTTPGVGAHAAHLAEAPLRGRVRCGHCHVVPETADAAGHVDDARPADVTFSGLAAMGGTPVRDGDRCAVYCHGSFFRVDPGQSPPWTDPSAGPLSCTACHGLPPASPHPAATDCGRCHIEVASLDGAIVHPSQHIDGVLQAPHGAHLVHLGGA
ncbi:MAG: CxxxxCH/CxxCH domain c-type cytochrome, partial [Acidobacteriota bacterium]